MRFVQDVKQGFRDLTQKEHPCSIHRLSRCLRHSMEKQVNEHAQDVWSERKHAKLVG